MSADRIGWLEGIIKSYEEDRETFGLVAEDEQRLAAWKRELKTLTAPKDSEA